jgi:hypothetical protein
VGQGIFLLHKTGYLDQLIGNMRPDASYDVAQEYFKIPMVLAEGLWEQLPFGEGTLYDHYLSLKHRDFDRQAEWQAVIDWMEVEIMAREGVKVDELANA